MVNELKVSLRNLLIEHATGPQPIIRGPEEHSRAALLRRELIRYEWQNGVAASAFPKATALTELGREVVCIILGDYADQIVASQKFLERLARKPKPVFNREVALAKLMADAAA
jgi:hypothetical protein